MLSYETEVPLIFTNPEPLNRLILAEPLNETPWIVLAVASVVALPAVKLAPVPLRLVPAPEKDAAVIEPVRVADVALNVFSVVLPETVKEAAVALEVAVIVGAEKLPDIVPPVKDKIFPVRAYPLSMDVVSVIESFVFIRLLSDVVSVPESFVLIRLLRDVVSTGMYAALFI